tara:strand:+ start:284 stop:946 length:663 start_codon:yes stop_codon:yes gene_type:complete
MKTVVSDVKNTFSKLVRAGVLFVAAGACLTVSGISNATFLDNSTGLTSPVTTVTFSEVALSNGAVVTNQFSAFGVEFGSLSPTAGIYFSSGGGSSGAGLQNFFPDTYNPFVISFSTAVSEAAFEMITNGTTDTFTALLNGAVVETASTATGGFSFYGFSGIVFDEIRVGIGGDVGTGNSRHMRLDNVQIGSAVSVPEPSTIALLGLGLFGAGYARRRYTH